LANYYGNVLESSLPCWRIIMVHCISSLVHGPSFPAAHWRFDTREVLTAKSFGDIKNTSRVLGHWEFISDW